jgi:hypothetical protein
MTADSSEREWYSVRCVFRITNADAGADDSPTYEERLTLWKAESHDEAIALAEAEATEYASGGLFEYLGIAQAFWLFDHPGNGAEIFSLMRDSELGPKAYLDQFFDTGRERQGHD